MKTAPTLPLALALARKPTLVGRLDPGLFADIKAHAQEAWESFASTNREDVPINIRPKISSFYSGL